MSVETKKGSEVKDYTGDLTDSDKVLGYNSSNGARWFSLSRIWNWIKGKTLSVMNTEDKSPINSSALSGALTEFKYTEKEINYTVAEVGTTYIRIAYIPIASKEVIVCTSMGTLVLLKIDRLTSISDTVFSYTWADYDRDLSIRWVFATGELQMRCGKKGVSAEYPVIYSAFYR